MVAQARTYGELWLESGQWHLKCEPHVAMMAKRVFQKIPRAAGGVIKLPNDPETCRMIHWLTELYPLRSTNADYLRKQSDAHVLKILRLNQIVDKKYEPRDFDMAVPPRDYQRVAAELYLQTGGLLLADELGLGKTCSAICSFTDPSTLPALVVCPAHLTIQWVEEIRHFMPDLTAHIVKKSAHYEFPKMMGRGPDVLIITYSKMAAWQDVLRGYVRSVIFEECHELRRGDSYKYSACRNVAADCSHRLGLSGTPIYNYGSEIWNILQVLKPDALGERPEFCTEWCDGTGDKAALKDPNAFGSFLREQGLMLRRTRREVKRELPPVVKQTVPIECDERALNAIEGAAGELARIILADSGSGLSKMQAAGELDVMLRMTTGIAKAPYVAAFVEMLLETAEPVVLWGWHRAVYDIWMERLKQFAPALYTGSESPAQKHRELSRFMEGQTPLLIMSLRSGSGVDGLQQRCRTGVFGELDWSPAVMDQCGGRLDRDGQTDPVTLYFTLSDDGADPMMAEILGIKRQQADGLIGVDRGPLVQVDHAEGIRKLAERYLQDRGECDRSGSGVRADACGKLSVSTTFDSTTLKTGDHDGRPNRRE